MNNVLIMGRPTKYLELKETNGYKVLRFTLAVDKNLSKEKRQELENKGEPTADFISCIAWNKTAEFIARYSNKGLRLLVNGSIQTGFYEKDYKRQYTTDVLVNNVEIIDWKDRNYNSSDEPTFDFGSDFRYNEEEDDRIPF